MTIVVVVVVVIVVVVVVVVVINRALRCDIDIRIKQR